LLPGNDPACIFAEAQSAFRGPLSLAFADRVIDLGGGPLTASAGAHR
jgi:hypothetical protein